MAKANKTSTDRLTERILSAHRSMIERENGSPSDLRSLHETAIDAFERLGIPGPGEEDWKYTPVWNWLPGEIQLSESERELNPEVPQILQERDGYLLVSVGGRFRPDLSRLPDQDAGMTVTAFSNAAGHSLRLIQEHLNRYARHDQEAFSALNAAFLQHGLFIHIARGAAIDRPVYVTDLISGTEVSFRQPRLLVLAESGSEVTLLEWYSEESGTPSAKEAIENSVSEFVVQENAHVRHAHIFDRGAGARLVNSMYVYQDRDSVFTTNHVTLTGSRVRHNLNFLPDAEGCETHLFGLVAARGDMHVDIHSFVDHAKPQSESNELYKCILDGNSTGVFNGKVLVRRDAQQINAYQSNRSILLSEGARMYSKPELEIYADDVKCSHGATTGRLDDEAVFYLRSRGLTLAQARLLLLQSFAAEVLEQIGVEEVIEILTNRLVDLLRPRS